MPTRIENILGSKLDADLHDRLHELDHDGLVEHVTVAVADLDRRRLVVVTDRGEEVEIALPRDRKLFDGAVLLLEGGRAIVVRAGEQRWLRVRPQGAQDALELGYHAGNLHWRVRFDGIDLLVALEGPTAAYAARLESLVSNGRVTLSEETE